MSYISFKISIPTDDRGFIGRACDSTGCHQYFKIFATDHKEKLYCPYCAAKFSKNDLLTGDQHKYVMKVAEEEATVYAAKEVEKMLKNAFQGSSCKKSGISYTPGRINKRQVRPHYRERKVDTELRCPTCETRFQVNGIFGYCPGCREENLSIYDTNWDIIKKEIESSENPQRALRHAYSDLVSTFENFCKRKATKLTSETCNFQKLFEARKFFKRHASIDIFNSLDTDSWLALRRLFNKRHVCIHCDGQITDKYTRMVPEDSKLLNQQVVLEFDELEDAATAIHTAFAVLVKSIEKPG